MNPEPKEFSHIDNEGRARMVDVTGKGIVFRKATASGFISLNDETVRLIRENLIKKGDVLTVAEIAGISAAKKTSDLIPLCHPLLLTNVEVKAAVRDDGVEITATVSCRGTTGVEMEALTAVSTGLLTVYDMCKAVDKNMQLKDIRLLEKIKTEV